MAQTKKRIRIEDDREYWRRQTPLTIFSEDVIGRLVEALPSPITGEKRDVLVRALRLLAHVQINEGRNPTPDSREERRSANHDLTRIQYHTGELQEILDVGARIKSRAWWELIKDDPCSLDHGDAELHRTIALIAHLGERAREALNNLPARARTGPRKNIGREVAVGVFIQLYEELSGTTAGRTIATSSTRRAPTNGFDPFARLAFKALFQTSAGLDDLVKTCLEHRRNGRLTVDYVKIVKEDPRAGMDVA